MEAVTFHLEEETLGMTLKRRREALGLSLGEVSEKTRIGISHLENIDREEFQKLPCLPYSRGFIRAYAACVGMDADAAAKQFNAETGLENA
ncbi:MAG: helix-turn-helix domain-containing protein [bacterium]